MKPYFFLFAAAFTVNGCSSSDNAPLTNTNTTVSDKNGFEADLVNRNWALTAYEDTGGFRSNHRNEVDFTFSVTFIVQDRVDGGVRRALSGDVVCNGYAAEYTLEDTVLSLRDVETTTNACNRVSEVPGPIFSRVLLSSDKINMLSIDGDVLKVSSASNETLIFTNSTE